MGVGEESGGEGNFKGVGVWECIGIKQNPLSFSIKHYMKFVRHVCGLAIHVM